ncbi:hypothetical protein C1H46_034385 [Malus baccata]|uniref:Uncharacterized protein n=1 Tax=Malus baccata TaxID=106549 RepID=A0A540L0P2_MALBA|nr:hypothetical protein C1H46_034385 [Malus baccata]
MAVTLSSTNLVASHPLGSDLVDPLARVIDLMAWVSCATRSGDSALVRSDLLMDLVELTTAVKIGSCPVCRDELTCGSLLGVVCS